jgi:WD40 repeat protein
VRFSKNNLLANSTREGKIIVRDAVSRAIICEVKGTPVGPNCIAFSPHEDLLAIGGSGAKAKIQIWNVRTGILTTEAIACLNGYIGRIHWGPNGHLVSGSSEGVLRVWEVDKDKGTIQCIKELAAKMNCLKMRINGAKSLDEPAPDGKGTLHEWFIVRGAVD